MTAEAYQLWTREGSRFLCRFDPVLAEAGIRWGRLKVVGDSVLAGRRVLVQGVGAFPEPGSDLTVSDRPLGFTAVEGEEVPIYPTETIVAVARIDLSRFQKG